MISKIKKPVSILLVFMMIVSLFAAVPMTVNAAPLGASLVGRYVETPGRGASNTMVFPDCDVYIKGVTGTQTIHNTSVTYSHSIEGSYDVLYFNGKEVYRGDWAVPDGIRIVSGSGTSSDPYVTEWYSTPTITWKLDEDTVIDTTKVPFDAVPTHAAPTKEPDEEYTYTFAGWSPEPVAVTDDATYTATFTAVPRPYNVNVETAEHGTVTANPAEAAKGNQVTLTAEPDAGYALSSIKAFKKNTNSQQATLTALDGSSTGGEGYDKLVDGNTNTKWGFNGGSGYIIVKADKAFRLNDYSLTTANDTNNYSGRNWKNWGIYGANFASDSEAVKNSDQWQLVTSVTNDSKLQATNFTRYDYSVNTDPEAYQYYKIEISANKGDGYTQMSELTLSGANYDVEVVLMQDSADPAKYTFEMPASNVTVKAEFEAIPTYTVTWKNGETTLKTDTVDKDAIPVYNGTTPEKAASEDNHYTFSGWSDGKNTYSADSLPAVTADVTYTAQFTEAAHTFNPTFNWTQDASTGDWNCDTLTLSCSCGAAQDYPVTGFFGASVVTCTANTDGSYTYSVSKTVDGTKYEDSKTYNANGVVKSATQLKAAAKKGGSWELGNDIDQAVGISCADGFVLDGNNYTVTRHSNSATSAVFVAANKNASFTLNDLTIDGIANQTEVRPAIASAQSNPNSGNVINLNNVKIINWDFDQDNNGAVLAWGQATVNMTNCDIDTDSNYDVWGGAASTINVDGGKAGTVYLNGGTSSATVDNGASVTVETSKPESVTIAPGYALNDNGDGTYTVVIDNSSPLNPIEKAAASINDGNKFGLTCDYLKGTLLGVQKKDAMDSIDKIPGSATTSESNQEGAKNIRFVAVLDTQLIQDMQGADDYGFVLAKVKDGSKTFDYSNTNFDNLRANWGNGEKTISAKDTYNNVCGTSETALKYGDPKDTSTPYKYITCAVNNMGDNDKVVARFYYKKDGVTHYAKYAGHNYQYTGCISTANAQ